MGNPTVNLSIPPPTCYPLPLAHTLLSTPLRPGDWAATASRRARGRRAVVGGRAGQGRVIGGGAVALRVSGGRWPEGARSVEERVEAGPRITCAVAMGRPLIIDLRL